MLDVIVTRMGEWIGLAEIAWSVWGLVWLWRRWRFRAPSGHAPVIRSAMLLSTAGTLDSIRTLVGPPPDVIQTAHARYRLDRPASQTHWVYRMSV